MEGDIVINNNTTKKWKKPLVIGAIVLFALIAIGIVVWNLWPRDYDKITLNNREELAKAVNGEEINRFRQELLNILRNDGIIDNNSSVNDVVIREGSVVSVTEDEKKGYLKTTTFLIDIDSIKQTYRVKILESNRNMDGVTAQIYCPNIDETKYPDSNCTGIYGTKNHSLKYNLPYQMKLSSGEKVLVKNIDIVKKDKTWTQTVQVYLYSCDNDNPPIAEAKAAVEKWVDSLEDPASQYYRYNIRTGYCEGDTI